MKGNFTYLKFFQAAIFSSLIAIFMIQFQARASFEDDLQRLAEDNAEEYIQPLITGFGMNINSGLFNGPKPHKWLGFDVTVLGMFDMVPDDELNYTFKFPTLTVPINLGAQTYEIPVNINSLVSDKSTPTVFGNDDPGNFLIDGDALTQMIMNSLYDLGADTTQYKNEIAQFSDSIASSLEVPKIPGVNFSFAPLAIPQVGFGLPWNADIVLRWMPSVKISDDVGEVGFFGIGARYCISQYIPMSPIDISAFAGYQTLWVGDFLDFSTFTFGAMAGRSFPIITPYLGLAFENTKVSVDYTLEDPIYNSGKTADISMDISGDNKFRATLGVKMGFLGIINLHAAYNIGKHNQLTAGLGIGFN